MIPGIQPADVVELLDRGASVVVLSTGVFQCLPSPPGDAGAASAEGDPRARPADRQGGRDLQSAARYRQHWCADPFHLLAPERSVRIGLAPRGSRRCRIAVSKRVLVSPRLS